MKKVLIIVAAIITVIVIMNLSFNKVQAADSDNREIVRAIQDQNKQLARIAESLERISGQRSGWKVPVIKE